MLTCMNATIGKGYSVGLDAMTVCVVCGEPVPAPFDGATVDVATVRAHLHGHYGQDAAVDFVVADMVRRALGINGGGGGFAVGRGNPGQPNSSSSEYFSMRL